MRPIVRFLDDPLETPENLVEPGHDPVRSAFVPYSTGLLMNEMKSYMEWMSARRSFSWMNEEWEYVEDLYSYWPYMENSTGASPNRYYFAYEPSIIYALVKIADDTFTVSGVVVLSQSPDLSLADHIEEYFPDKGVTRLNMSLVPLEMFDIPEETVESVVYFWINALRSLDWSSPVHRIDTMVFWSNSFRELFNRLMASGGRVTSYPMPDTDTRHYTTEYDIMHTRGLVLPTLTYNDPITTSAFMGDLRSRMPELPVEATIGEVSHYFGTGQFTEGIGSDPGMYHRLNAILCTYPEDIQERLLSGVVTSLDPRNADKIGAGFDVGKQPTRQGEQLLCFESILQPRPQPGSPQSEEAGGAEE